MSSSGMKSSNSLQKARGDRHVLSFRQNWTEIVQARSLHWKRSFREKDSSSGVFSVFFDRLGSIDSALFFSVYSNSKAIDRIES